MKIILDMLKAMEHLNSMFSQAEDDIEELFEKLKSQKKYDEAGLELARLASLEKLKQKFRDFEFEFKREFATQLTIDIKPRTQERRTRQDLEKLEHGLRTNQSEFILPILQTLHEMGGSGKLGDVLERVGEIMKDVLNRFDKSPLPKNPQKRWLNAAQWARNEMVHTLGYMRNDSPRGTWEITAKGETYLASKRINK